MKIYSTPLFTLLLIALLSCKHQEKTDHIAASERTGELRWPQWVTQGNIYEVNIRQYTPEGTFVAMQQHLPRLQQMGVKILWLMPIFPISSTKRKGGLGSYYAVSDYRNTNPEFGSIKDFDSLVTKAHTLGMKVILDWVPNHTGWDHKWISEHPDYYTKGTDGNITDPLNPDTGESWGWSDVADLNYDNTDMREQMTSDLLYWVQEHGIDGYRFDISHGVPIDFWRTANPTLLRAYPDLFLLSESELQQHVSEGLFHAIYGWPAHHMMNDIAKGNTATIDKLHKWIVDNELKAGVHMHFTSNHDENSWAGTTAERLGDGADAFAVLAATMPGIPLIYGGQEEPLDKRLQFFEKDNIGFHNYKKQKLYTRLLQLKSNEPALAAKTGVGSNLVRLDASDGVYAYIRGTGSDAVLVILNLSNKLGKVTIPHVMPDMKNMMTGTTASYSQGQELVLNRWAYIVATATEKNTK